MVWRHQRLLPLIYREESWRGKKRRFKEYRFDYARGRLELWEWHEGKGLAKKWQTGLADQVYDPLSAFYNIRLGLLKPNREGETGTIPGIPYPRPEAMVVRLGTTTESGLKAMVSLNNPIFPDSRGQVFAYVDKHFVPREAWTTISGITLRARLQPESAIMPPGLAALEAPGLPASRRPPDKDLPATAGQGEKSMIHPRDWYVEIAGQGPDLVLLHGLGASSFSWRHNRGPLSRHFRVITPDLPGHGRSPAPVDGDYRTEALVRGVVDFLDWQGLDTVALGGNSLGGGLSLVLASEHPARVSALALLAPAAALTRIPYAFWPLRLPVLGYAVASCLGPWLLPWFMRLVYCHPAAPDPGGGGRLCPALPGAQPPPGPAPGLPAA